MDIKCFLYILEISSSNLFLLTQQTESWAENVNFDIKIIQRITGLLRVYYVPVIALTTLHILTQSF